MSIRRTAIATALLAAASGCAGPGSGSVRGASNAPGLAARPEPEANAGQRIIQDQMDRMAREDAGLARR